MMRLKTQERYGKNNYYKAVFVKIWRGRKRGLREIESLQKYSMI